MIDEIFDRQYQSGRAALNDGLDRGFAAIGREFRKTFDAFHDIQWSAPWTARAKARVRKNRARPA